MRKHIWVQSWGIADEQALRRALDADSGAAALHTTENSVQMQEQGDQGGQASVYLSHSLDKVRAISSMHVQGR